MYPNHNLCVKRMLRLLALAFMLVHTALGAPTELYFEFDDRATSVSTAPGYFFCLAAVDVLTPTYNGSWCLDAATNYKYSQTVYHGRLSNVRITIPTAPEVRVDDEGVRRNLSTALLSTGFFLSPADVAFVNHSNDSKVLNAVLTWVTCGFLFASMIVPGLVRRMLT